MLVLLETLVFLSFFLCIVVFFAFAVVVVGVAGAGVVGVFVIEDG